MGKWPVGLSSRRTVGWSGCLPWLLRRLFREADENYTQPGKAGPLQSQETCQTFRFLARLAFLPSSLSNTNRSDLDQVDKCAQDGTVISASFPLANKQPGPWLVIAMAPVVYVHAKSAIRITYWCAGSARRGRPPSYARSRYRAGRRRSRPPSEREGRHRCYCQYRAGSSSPCRLGVAARTR